MTRPWSVLSKYSLLQHHICKGPWQKVAYGTFPSSPSVLQASPTTHLLQISTGGHALSDLELISHCQLYKPEQWREGITSALLAVSLLNQS